MFCPNCGSKSFREARQCPACGGQPVCITCCQGCEYYSRQGIPCRWYIRNPQRDTEKDIEGLKKKADIMKKKMMSLREKKQYAAARRLEEDWWLLWSHIKELEKEHEKERL